MAAHANARELELPGGVALTIRQASDLNDDAGAVVWDAALVLAHYLAEQRLREQRHAADPCAPPSRVRLTGARVLELGAGPGAVGLAAAALGARQVLLTDRPHLLPLMQDNIQVNELEGTVCAAALEWGHPLPPQALAGAPWDLVLLSDLVYEREQLPALLDTLTALLDAQPVGSGAARIGSGSGGGSEAGSSGAGGGSASMPCNGGGTAEAAPSLRVASPVALVAVELRTDTIVAQFVRSVVQRRLLVERVPAGELSEQWRDDDIWVFTVRRLR